MIIQNALTLNGREVLIEGERNLLELSRKAGVDIPTFCYHSELSIYGACRLCLVEIDGQGIQASCSVMPEPGMVVQTHTEEIREMRKTALELILANHDQNCPTCPKNRSCELQSLTRKLGVNDVRFKRTHEPVPVDRSSESLVRDANKCVLCGDCVRACDEIQGVGAIDFAHRGADSTVCPPFGKALNEVECVDCGLCAAVCPTGAITPKDDVDQVWAVVNDPTKKVVVQVAPAVRVAVGEMFGMEPGTVEMGRIVAALKMIGVDQVFDTSFTADMTVLEEAEEFLDRKTKGEKLPQFTSCCPAWVKFAEQFFPKLLDNLSSCKSPQQMFGSLAKSMLPTRLGVDRKDLIVVSIMPCTAKKDEAKQDKFVKDGAYDVDIVLTTQELARMIEEAGIRFPELKLESLDMPLGFKTGAGVIFGTTGGVTEAVLRYAVEKLKGEKLEAVDFHEVRGLDNLREAELEVEGQTIRLAIVHGLATAKKLAQSILDGECEYDLIEVMACPGGRGGGTGQPVSRDWDVRAERQAGIYKCDKMLQLHKAQDNHLLADCYEREIGEVGGHKAHEMLHTSYRNRRRIFGLAMPVSETDGDPTLKVSVCVGTSCFVRGSQQLIQRLTEFIQAKGLDKIVQVEATFCSERCDRGPTIIVGEQVIEKCTFETAVDVCEFVRSRQFAWSRAKRKLSAIDASRVGRAYANVLSRRRRIATIWRRRCVCFNPVDVRRAASPLYSRACIHVG